MFNFIFASWWCSLFHHLLSTLRYHPGSGDYQCVMMKLCFPSDARNCPSSAIISEMWSVKLRLLRVYCCVWERSIGSHRHIARSDAAHLSPTQVSTLNTQLETNVPLFRETLTPCLLLRTLQQFGYYFDLTEAAWWSWNTLLQLDKYLQEIQNQFYQDWDFQFSLNTVTKYLTTAEISEAFKVWLS